MNKDSYSQHHVESYHQGSHYFHGVYSPWVKPFASGIIFLGGDPVHLVIRNSIQFHPLL
ncbi:MAG: hypothetical protein ABSF48_12720 [Thermodesulfobacteriota bacterium]